MRYIIGELVVSLRYIVARDQCMKHSGSAERPAVDCCRVPVLGSTPVGLLGDPGDVELIEQHLDALTHSDILRVLPVHTDLIKDIM